MICKLYNTVQYANTVNECDTGEKIKQALVAEMHESKLVQYITKIH